MIFKHLFEAEFRPKFGPQTLKIGRLQGRLAHDLARHGTAATRRDRRSSDLQPRAALATWEADFPLIAS
jgi:hypothetical protein